MKNENIKVIGEALASEEIANYVAYLEKKHGKLESLEIKTDGEYVDLNFKTQPKPFERIRRITGYLVGDMKHWNDAKLAEESDRVRHDL